MANVTLGDLEEVTTLNTTDILHFRTAVNIDKKITVEDFTEDIHKNLLQIRFEEPSGTRGGHFTAEDWRTRPLDTVVTNEIAGASLSSNQITLPVGTFFVEWQAEAYGNVHNHQSRLYNITDAAVLALGSSEYIGTAGGYPATASLSIGFGRFDLSGTKVLELQHQCLSSIMDLGMGEYSGFTVDAEVYCSITIRKIV